MYMFRGVGCLCWPPIFPLPLVGWNHSLRNPSSRRCVEAHNPCVQSNVQIQLWSNSTTKITDLVMNGLPNEKINIDGSMYKLHSVICHHGNSMASAHYTCIIRFHNKWVRCNDSNIYYDRWPRGAKDVYIIILQQ